MDEIIMPSIIPIPFPDGQTRLENIDLLDLLPADEGEINQIYGRIGSGKTYCATKDIIDDLKRGQVWYLNWKIKWDGYDERTSKWLLFLGILGLKKTYYIFPKENLHFINVDKDIISTISKLTDCKIGLDEGHIVFDSYKMAKQSMEERNAILWTRHFDRSYLIISQRPSAIHKNMRANINRYYKCEKTSDFKIFGKRFQRFLKTEFQDVTPEDIPNEERIKKLNEDTHMLEDTEEYQYAISQKRYWGKKKIFESYDTKYRRNGLQTSQQNYAQVIHIPWLTRFKMLW